MDKNDHCKIVNGRHQATAMCAMGEKRSWKRRREEEARRSTAVAFQFHRRPLEEVLDFKYFGRVITASDDNFPEVVGNLRRMRSRRARVLRILGREGAEPWTSGKFYKVVLQATLLFGEEPWVITSRNERTLGRFYHSVARRMANMKPRRYMTGRWV